GGPCARCCGIGCHRGRSQQGCEQTVVVGSGTVRRPEQATYVRTAGVEGVTGGERAARGPGETSRIGLFALMTVARQASGIYPQAGGTRPNGTVARSLPDR